MERLLAHVRDCAPLPPGTLKELCSMQALDLGGRRIGLGGAERLEGVLWAMPKLTNLDLRDNNLGSAGAAAVARALQ